MKLTSNATILSFDPFTVDTGSSTHNLGEAVVLADNRKFAYAKASSTSSVGKLQTAPAPITNHHNMAMTAVALGATQVTVTPAATGGAANIYAEGYLVINDNDGEGRTYQVKGHPTITSSVAFTVDLFDPITGVAGTTAQEASLVHNNYNAVIEGTSATVRPAGVPYVTAAAGNYFWLATRGVASVLNGATVTLGAPQINSGATAGAVVDQTDNLGASAEIQVGVASIMAGVSTEYRPIFLQIA